MRVCACLCIVQNELIRGYASVVYTLSSFRPHTRTHTHTHYDTHILIPFEDRKPTGLKVDIAENADKLVLSHLLTRLTSRECLKEQADDLAEGFFFRVTLRAHRLLGTGSKGRSFYQYL